MWYIWIKKRASPDPRERERKSGVKEDFETSPRSDSKKERERLSLRERGRKIFGERERE